MSDLRDLRHLLIDLDGVLYRGSTALPGAQEFIQFLTGAGVTFRLVTNNATLTPGQYVAKLAGMGIQVEAEAVFTSALATASYLRAEDPGTAAFVVGEDGLVEALQEAGISVVENDPRWVVVGLDRQLTYAKLAAAALAIEAGARFLATNADASFPTEAGLLPGAGAIDAALTTTTGVQPIVVGKPQPLMLRLAMESLGGTIANTAMLGDRLDTDIAAAQALGMPSILVLTGVSTQAEVAAGPYHPSFVLPGLPALQDAWAAALAGSARI